MSEEESLTPAELLALPKDDPRFPSFGHAGEPGHGDDDQHTPWCNFDSAWHSAEQVAKAWANFAMPEGGQRCERSRCDQQGEYAVHIRWAVLLSVVGARRPGIESFLVCAKHLIDVQRHIDLREYVYHDEMQEMVGEAIEIPMGNNVLPSEQVRSIVKERLTKTTWESVKLGPGGVGVPCADPQGCTNRATSEVYEWNNDMLEGPVYSWCDKPLHKMRADKARDEILAERPGYKFEVRAVPPV